MVANASSQSRCQSRRVHGDQSQPYWLPAPAFTSACSPLLEHVYFGITVMLTVNEFTPAKQESAWKVNVSRKYVLGKTRKNFRTVFSCRRNHPLTQSICASTYCKGSFKVRFVSLYIIRVLFTKFFCTRVKSFLINIISKFRLQILQRNLSFRRHWLCFCYFVAHLRIPGTNSDTEMSVEVFVAFYSATLHIYLFPFFSQFCKVTVTVEP